MIRTKLSTKKGKKFKQIKIVVDTSCEVNRKSVKKQNHNSSGVSAYTSPAARKTSKKKPTNKQVLTIL